MSHRFFVRASRAEERIELDGAEAHHLLHVMRARIGDAITVFDGEGHEYPGTVAKLGRATVGVELGRAIAVDRELPFRLTVGVALPKGDRQRWLVEKLVELGVTTCVPLRTARGVAQFEGGAPERLARAVIEASKQCGRNRLLEIGDAMSTPDFLAAAGGHGERWLAHPPAAEGLPASAGLPPLELGTDIWVAVGPEGGFTDEEVDAARQAGWRLIGLGPRILRIETAALALVAALASRADWRLE